MGGSAQPRPEAGPRRWSGWRAGGLGLVVAVLGVLAFAVLWQWLSGGSGDASAAPAGVAGRSPSAAASSRAAVASTPATPRPSSAPATPTAPASSAAPGSAATEVVVTRWESGVEVSATVEMRAGDACQQSISTERADAFRCFAGDLVHDPCFVTERGAVCPQAPWARRATLLQGATPTPDSVAGPLAQGLPWGIELVNGQRCTFLGGATDLLDDLRASYGCDRGTVYGEPSGDRQWTVRLRPDGDDRLTTVAVATAWY